MNRKDLCRAISWAILALLLSAGIGLAELPVPALTGRVNDYAGMLSPAVKQKIETSLAEFERKESTQIVVLTVPSLEGESIEGFSLKAAEKWGIGQKGRDNGALLVIARDDRKLRIEVGYGLEGRLTDLISGRIIRNVIVPAFRAGDFDGGVAAGVAAMMDAVRGQYAGAKAPSKPARKGGSPNRIVFPAIIFVFLLIQLGRVRRSMATVAGGVLLPVFGSFFWPAGLLTLLLLIPAGLAAGFLLSLVGGALAAAAPASRRGYRGGYWGGGFFGGGFGGGGFGGGGFSGGGGGFGGGGASGGW